VVAGILVSLSITSIPGPAGHEPAEGLKTGGAVELIALMGIAFAALAALSCGAVLSPEAPLIAIGGGLGILAVRLAVKDAPPTAATVMAAGIGTLIFIGLDNLTGLGTFSLAIPGLPTFSHPIVAMFGWALAIGVVASWRRGVVASWRRGVVASLIVAAIRLSDLARQSVVGKQRLLSTPLAGLVVAMAAIAFAEVTH
jgi:hypothetical protein